MSDLPSHGGHVVVPPRPFDLSCAIREAVVLCAEGLVVPPALYEAADHDESMWVTLLVHRKEEKRPSRLQFAFGRDGRLRSVVDSTIL